MTPVGPFLFLYACLKKPGLFCLIVAAATPLFLLSCHQPAKEPTHKKVDYIRKIEGKSDSIPVAMARRGEILIAYSDCKDCHTKTKRAKGPSFQDIAEKYPANNVFIEMLAQRIIHGGFGTWGKPVMAAHPHLSPEEAKMMAMYILSLKKR